MKKAFTLFAKISVSLLALVLVFYKIDKAKLLELILTVDWVWLSMALVFFMFSKVLSAIRLQYLFDRINLKISTSQNLKLYLLGMFYNTALPGGVGGDGYKIWLLSNTQKYQHVSKKKLISTVLYDRLIGLGILVGIILMLLVNYYPLQFIVPAVFMLLASCVFLQSAFFTYQDIVKPGILSVGVQVCQMVAVGFIILSIGATHSFYELLIVFLISSVASVIPLSIGGVGVREFVFFYLSSYMEYPTESGVMIALLFFLLTFLVSLSGLYYSISSPEKVFDHDSTITHQSA